jgi:hypothetical protein
MSRSISTLRLLFLLPRNDDTETARSGIWVTNLSDKGITQQHPTQPAHHDNCEIASIVLGRKGAMDDEWPSHGGQSRKSPWLLG